MSDPMSRQWCFTVNNPPPAAARADIPTDGVSYLVFQLEEGENGTPHFQGYIRFAAKKRFSTVKRWFEEISTFHGAHIEKSKGSEQQNKDYCTKEPRLEGPYEFGEFVPHYGEKGHRSDLDDIARMCKEGKPIREIAETHAGDFIRYHAGIQALHLQVAPLPPIQRDITIIVLWGPTATGKTHRFMTTYPDIYSVKPGRDPWGQYRNQNEILFDEFDPEKWSIQDMNRYLDKWRCMLDARYTDRYAAWTLVGICANSSPTSWWMNAAPMLIDAFRRRIRGHVWLVNSQDPTLEEIMTTPPTPL